MTAACKPRARLRQPQLPSCLGCSWQHGQITEVSHHGVPLRFCEDCLRVAQRLALLLADDSPPALVHAVALAASGWEVDL